MSRTLHANLCISKFLKEDYINSEINRTKVKTSRMFMFTSIGPMINNHMICNVGEKAS